MSADPSADLGRARLAIVLRAGLLLVAVSVAVVILAPVTAVFVLGLAAYGSGWGWSTRWWRASTSSTTSVPRSVP